MTISSLERRIYSEDGADLLWHTERVWLWSKQISKLVAWEIKKPTFPDATTVSPPPLLPPPDMTRPKKKPRNSILMMCHPELSSAFVWLKICYIQVYLFTTFWHFVWLAFVHARSSIGLRTTLESRASPGTSPETGSASASHWCPLWEGRPTSEVQGACWPWRR